MSWGDYTLHSAAEPRRGRFVFGVWGSRERKTIGEAAALVDGVDAQPKRLKRVLHESHHGSGVPSDIDA